MQIRCTAPYILTVKKSQIASVCLFAFALAISVTEYVMFTPRVGIRNTQAIDDAASNNENDTEDDRNNDVDTFSDNTSTQPASTAEQQSGTVEKQDDVVTLTVQSGDTVSSMLINVGFNNNDVFNCVEALTKIFNLRVLRIGQQITVYKNIKNGENILKKLEIVNNHQIVTAVREKNGQFIAKKEEIPVTKILRSVSATIDNAGPVANLVACGAANNVARNAVCVMSRLVDINAVGACIEVLCYDIYSQKDNKYLRSELVYVAALVNGKIYKIYKFDDKNFTGYVQSNGVVVPNKSNTNLRSPLSKMSVSSPFGVRVHPVTGVVKRHDGVDLRASYGTCVYAAASGRVVVAGWRPFYGKYILIDHGGGIKTAYAHLSSIDIRTGQFVQSGYPIGKVGSTGRTTGPHLHYEVIKCGVRVNPMKHVKIDVVKKIPASSTANFEKFKRSIGVQVVGFTPSEGKQATVRAYS